MKLINFLKIAISTLALLTFASHSQAQQSLYEKAVKDPRRPAADVERDAGRKPAQVLEFFNVKPGQRVVDLMSSTGYYTRILSGIVGSEGSVVAQNSGRRYDDERKAALTKQYESYDNIELNFEAPDQNKPRSY